MLECGCHAFDLLCANPESRQARTKRPGPSIMSHEQRELQNEVLRARVRALAVRNFQWGDGLQEVKKPLFDIGALVDLDILNRLAKQVQRNGIVIVTFISQEYLRVGLNWIEAMKRLKLTNFLVVAGDLKTCQILTDRDVTHIEARVGIGQTDSAYRSAAGFTEKGLAMTTLKFPIVSALLDDGYDVIMSDADAIWLRDPIPYMPGLADIAFQRVLYFPAPISQLWGFAACSGFAFFRHCAGTSGFVKDCIREQKKVQDDQLALNLALLDGVSSWQGFGATDQCHDDTQAKFVARAKVPIKGHLDRHGLELLALAHHEFWRHSLVPTSPSEMVICHPNSPKCDADKMKCFEELQVNFLQ
jgi:hypothetical protein